MKKIIFIGGDQRSVTAYEELKNKGYFVGSMGLFPDENDDICYFDVIVLPVPSTRDNKTVFCPLTNRKIYLSDIEKEAENRLVLSCAITLNCKNNIDYLRLDGYSYLNAVPTAEGAIAFAINNTPYTLWKSKILIVGFGRVAKILYSRLNAFGSDITVSARKNADFSLLDTQNVSFTETSKVKEKADEFDIIFNTVDINIFDDFKTLKNTFLIDLSSKGCLDFEKAKIEGINAFKLPGIPGKTAPLTAGKILAKTVMQLINQKI